MKSWLWTCSDQGLRATFETVPVRDLEGLRLPTWPTGLILSLLILCMSGIAACGGTTPVAAPQPTTQRTDDAQVGKKQPAKSKIDDKDKDSEDDEDDEEEDTSDDQDDTPGATGSRGTGGATGLVEVSFSAAGLNSSYKINAPADAASGKLYGLHVHFHGDGGGGYRDFPNREIHQNLIGVTVKSPNQNLQWWVGSPVVHADYVNQLIQSEILRKYNVDTTRIYFSGVSGGSYFLSGYFLPKYGQLYNSGAFLMCGGMPPQVNFAQPSFLKAFNIYWQVTGGERDDIMQDVRDSVNAYARALSQAGGSNATQGSDTEGQGGHCEFYGRDYTGGIQEMMNRKFNVVLKP